MEEYEILLNDLKYQEALLELERGYKITKKDIIDFVAELLKGDRNDKDYQQKIVDNLVSQVFVSDDHTVVYFNIKGGKTVDLVALDDTNIVLKTSLDFRMQTSTSRQQTKRTFGSKCSLFFVYPLKMHWLIVHIAQCIFVRVVFYLSKAPWVFRVVFLSMGITKEKCIFAHLLIFI